MRFEVEQIDGTENYLLRIIETDREATAIGLTGDQLGLLLGLLDKVRGEAGIGAGPQALKADTFTPTLTAFAPNDVEGLMAEAANALEFKRCVRLIRNVHLQPGESITISRPPARG